MKIELLDFNKFVVVDLEGNGQNPPDIVEIAVQPLFRNEEVAERGKTWLVKPPRKITGFAQRIHHISNKDVESSPVWNDVKSDVFEAIRNKIIIAHNAGVERKVLSSHISEWKPKIILDTLKLSRATWKNLDSHSLDSLIKEKNLIREDMNVVDRHRAGFDAYVTAILFLRLIEDSAVTTENELFEISNIVVTKPVEEQKQGDLFL